MEKLKTALRNPGIIREYQQSCELVASERTKGSKGMASSLTRHQLGTMTWFRGALLPSCASSYTLLVWSGVHVSSTDGQLKLKAFSLVGNLENFLDENPNSTRQHQVYCSF